MSDDQQFRVGEACYLLPSAEWPEYPLSECTVIGGARLFRRGYRRDGSLHIPDMFRLQYEVRDQAGEVWITTPDLLRKRRPPQDWVRLCRLNERPEHVH